jgi:ABC-2 type transport system permease protein
MSPFGAVLATKLRLAGHTIASVKRESKLKVVFVSTSVVLLWLAAFGLSKAGFSALDRFGAGLLGTADLSLVELLAPRVLAVFALVLFVLLIFSNALLAHATLYRSAELPLLLVSPLSFRTLYLERFIEIVTFSSWSTAYLGSPIVLAYGLVRHAGWQFYAGAALLFVPFVTIPAAVGAIMAMLVVRFLPRLPRLVLGASAVLALGAAFIFFRGQLTDVRFKEISDLSAVLRLTDEAASPLLPSSWFANGLLAGTRGSAGDVTYDLLLLVANALFLTWLGGEVAQAFFHQGWSGLAGAARRAKAHPAHDHGDALTRLLAPISDPVRSLTVKDIRLFIRDPAQWSQFALFFGMLLLYVANMRPGTHGFSTTFWQGWITLLNTVAGLLVLATLTTRFVFPLLSLEGRRFWILSQAPLSRRRVVVQKFWLSVAFSAAITAGLVLLSGWRLRLTVIPFAFSLFTVLAASLALSGLAVGLGSLYPNFREESPARIVSGLGGTLTFILSVMYVVAVAGVETAVLQWSTLGRHFGGVGAYPWAIALATLLTLAVTALTTLVPLRFGIRNLERLEI